MTALETSAARSASPRVRQTALRSLLRQYPDAFVAAIAEDGMYVDVPPSLAIDPDHVLHARSTLQLVVPAESELVLATWERARATGGATAQLHLRSDPRRAAVIHFMDLRARHGVYVGVLVSDDGVALPDIGQIAPTPPRIARVRKNELAVFTEVDDAIIRLLDRPAEALLGHRSLEFIHPDDQERAIQTWMQMLSEPDRAQPAVRLRHQRSDGAWIWFEVTNHNRLADPSAAHVLAEMIDISDEMAAHEALEAREQLLRRLAETLPIGVFQVLSDGRIAYTNERLATILGVRAAGTLDEQLSTVTAEDRPLVDMSLDAALRSGIDGDLEIQVRPASDLRARRCMLRIRTLTDGAGGVTGAVVSVEDVTESAQLRAELERRASHDMLTRLLNRASVVSALEAVLAVPAPGGTAVIFIDLDDFKDVNDRLGHLAGDELLRVVADRLAISVRGGDPLGRIGGDEFLVVCPRVGGAAPALAVAERIAEALRQPVRLAGTSVPVRASVGVAYAGGRTRADLLVRQADSAMYLSKRQAEGRPVVWSAAVRRAVGAAMSPGAPRPS